MKPIPDSFLIHFTLHLADDALILSQINAEWCGHGPVLEQDIAITNISLDLLGQARNFYQYAAELMNKEGNNGVTEDSLAGLRKENEFRNCLLVEIPRGDWARTVLRQFLFSQFQQIVYQRLQEGKDERIASIAGKSLKEITYHLRWSVEWVIRLGDGTEESRKRMEQAIDDLWRYTGELFMPAGYESGFGLELPSLKNEWDQRVKQVFDEAGLRIPESVYMMKGGKEGVHTEHMGYLLAELQFMQRAYPGANW